MKETTNYPLINSYSKLSKLQKTILQFMDTYGKPICRTRLTHNIGLLLQEQKKSENKITPLQYGSDWIDPSFAVVFSNSLHALIKRGLVKGNYPYDIRYKRYYQRIQTVELTDEGKRAINNEHHH